MKLVLIFGFCIIMAACQKIDNVKPAKIIFIHHSTGKNIWNGNQTSIKFKLGNLYSRISGKSNMQAAVPTLFKEHNREYATNYKIEELTFPKSKPYGWKNYPFDYYNIWVKHAGEEPYMEEPTLEILTKKYDIIMFKHCFPTSNIQPDKDAADINSDYKSIANYKLQYNALKEKMHQFPGNKFIVWTGAAQVESQVTAEEAKRAREFFNWVVEEWDQPDDNIFVWDFYKLQTEGNLFLDAKKTVGENDSHPNKSFSNNMALELKDFIIKTYSSKN